MDDEQVVLSVCLLVCLVWLHQHGEVVLQPGKSSAEKPGEGLSVDLSVGPQKHPPHPHTHTYTHVSVPNKKLCVIYLRLFWLPSGSV